MKTRELYSIVLKIIGLIALWHSVTMISAVIMSGFALVTALSSPWGNSIGGFFVASILTIVIHGVLSLMIAFYCLLRTEILIKALKLDDDTTLELVTDRKVIYHVLILSFGVFLLGNGANGFLVVEFNTDTKTGMLQTMNNIGNDPNAVSIIESKNYKMNILALIELLVGFYLLLKSRSISERLLGKVDSSNNA